jgi:hypothetical protein
MVIQSPFGQNFRVKISNLEFDRQPVRIPGHVKYLFLGAWTVWAGFPRP